VGGKKYQNRNAFGVVACNAFAVTAACSSESTDGTFSVVCGQKQQHLRHVCWSLIFSLVINLMLFALRHCDLDLITVDKHIDGSRCELIKVPLKIIL